MPNVLGSLVKVSREDDHDSADLEWHISASEIKMLEPYLPAKSLPVSFAGWDWEVYLEKHWCNCKLGLRLYRDSERPSRTPLVRYCMGAKKGGDGEEVIRRGVMEGDHERDSGFHTWMHLDELKKRMERSSADTLTIFVKLRTGPETDGCCLF